MSAGGTIVPWTRVDGRAKEAVAMGTVVPIREAEDAFSDIGGKYLSITTFKRDGSAVATPVWFVHDFERLLVQTDANSGKARRIRRDPNVTVAMCTARGAVRGVPVRAHAEILSDIERPRLERLMRQKYRFAMVVFGSIRAMESLLHLGRGRGEPIVLAITAETLPSAGSSGRRPETSIDQTLAATSDPGVDVRPKLAAGEDLVDDPVVCASSAVMKRSRSMSFSTCSSGLAGVVGDDLGHPLRGRRGPREPGSPCRSATRGSRPSPGGS